MLHTKNTKRENKTAFYQVARAERKAVALGQRVKAERRAAHMAAARELIAGAEYL